MYGVKPVDDEGIGDPGVGSEKRTRFLGFVGVFPSSKGGSESRLTPLTLELPWTAVLPEVSSGRARAELDLRFRRTAMGKSSACTDGALEGLAIVGEELA